MKTILYCNCSRANLTSDSARQAALSSLDEAGAEYLYTDDLCGLCADAKASSELAARVHGTALTVLACFPRTVNALLTRAGCRDAATVEIVNLRASKPEAIAAQLNLSDVRPGGKVTLSRSNTDWEPWYPLIDSDRCRQCKQCLNFCLFGVYALDAEQVVGVVQPTHCKTGCPACARVCPFAAIVFPKYNTAPINGDTVDEAAWKNTPPPADLQQRLRGNVMGLLRRRTAAGGADSLEQMKDQLGIPDSVIENLKKETPR
jgi:Pyruvate/2-oxoacid:ferredoxin oxidoreductase delta subunit